MRHAFAVVLVVAGCRAPASTSPVPERSQTDAGLEVAELADANPSETPTSRIPGRPVVLITEPAELARLTHAHDFGALVFDHPAKSTSELHELPEYRAFVDELDHHFTGHVNFPRWWFNHSKTTLSLVAIVNRIDRRDFGSGPCGETRLIFRLGYTEPDGLQRLPVGLNLVFEQPDDGQGCVEVARRWMVTGDEIDALTGEGGPLAPAALSRDQLLALESNVRVAEESASDAVNELRVFKWNSEHSQLQPALLEFQPPYKSMIVRANVRALLTPEGLADIERGAGTPMLLTGPGDRWASVDVPAGPQNQPYQSIWQRIDPEAMGLPTVGLTSTPNGLQHRLDGMSCTGCHALRSVAGFHLPGEGGSERLLGGASAHLLSELPWRERYVEALANGEAPERTRKLHNDGPPGFGRHCSVAGSPIDSLACDPGFSCVDAPTFVPSWLFVFGVCLPDDHEGPGPCEQDSSSCRAPSPWFPGGFERHACVDGQPCAPVPVTTDFAACRETDDAWACAHERAKPTRVDGCALQSDCRDGYACVDAAGSGVCLPFATLAEFRLIGHSSRLR
jgi:hypothetical protein